jgi:hypothetical protein
MTSSGGGTEAAPRTETGKSLKDQNRWQLWIIVAANSLFLYGVVQTNAIKSDGVRAAFTDGQNLVPIGLALVITTVLNGLVSADSKARLVFLRWRHALPGHRAFTKYAVLDPRINLSSLEKLHGCPLPVEPVEQNRAWYRIYKTVENDQAVRQAHRDFLLMRDYTGLCAVFIAFYGAAGLFAIPSMKIRVIYLLVLIAQYAVVRWAACNYGIRLVTTVLARRTAEEWSDTIERPRKGVRSKHDADSGAKPVAKPRA